MTVTKQIPDLQFIFLISSSTTRGMVEWTRYNKFIKRKIGSREG